MLKQAVESVLAKRGYSLIRSEPRTPVKSVLYTDAELAQLDRDLAGLNLNPKDYEIWTSAGAVREYLKKERINFYHALVKASVELGVDFTGKKVLDVGTCSGYLLRIIEQQYPGVSVAGTDYYEECVRLSAGLVPSAHVFQASVDDLKSSDETYDVIFCTEVLEHILDTETQIPSLLALVNPGGALVLTVPNGTHDFTPSFTSEDGVSFVGHVNFWSPQSWKYYINRIVAPARIATAELGVNHEQDALVAIIFKD